MFLLVLAYPGCPGSKAVKRLCVCVRACVRSSYKYSRFHYYDTRCYFNVRSKAGTHTHIHPFNGPLFGTTQVSRYRKSKTNLDFTEARDSEWQWHQLGHMQICISLQTDNHASIPPLSFLQAGCPSCRPTNNVKALKRDTTTKKCKTEKLKSKKRICSEVTVSSLGNPCSQS